MGRNVTPSQTLCAYYMHPRLNASKAQSQASGGQEECTLTFQGSHDNDKWSGIWMLALDYKRKQASENISCSKA